MRSVESAKAEEELYKLQAEFCKGMAHPKRIQVLRILKDGERSVGELATLTRIPQANVSQHLAILRQFGLLNTRREGATIYYSITDHRVIEACELVRACIGERLKKSQLILTIRS